MGAMGAIGAMGAGMGGELPGELFFVEAFVAGVAEWVAQAEDA